MRRETTHPRTGKAGALLSAALVIVWSASTAQAQWREVWRTQADNGQNLTEVDIDVEVDSAGNIITIGWIVDPVTGSDLLLRKYDRTGRLLWTRTYDGGGGGDEYFITVVIDSNDNIITSGTAFNANGNRDIVTFKYDPDGNVIWTAPYDGPLGGHDECYGWPPLALDAADNVYVCGSSQALDGVYDLVTIKYDSAGTEQWAARYRGPNQTVPQALGYALAYTPSGHVYVAGTTRNVDGNGDYLLLKYDSNGQPLWDRLFDSAYHGWEAPYTMVVDDAENIFLVGISDSQYLNNDFEYCAVKYAPDGTFQWEGRYGGDFGFHYGWVGEPDGTGGVYVSGASMTGGGEYDIATVRFDTNGNTAWVRRFRNPRWFGDDWAYGLCTDLDDNLLVAGFGWNGHGNGDDAYLLKYSRAGDLLDSVVYDSPIHGDDWWTAVTVDDAGRAIVAGVSLGLGTGADSIVGKYTTAPPPELVINPDPLQPRSNANFTVTDMEPHSACYLAYSVQGSGNVFVPLLNTTLGIRSPQQAGGIVLSDSAGTAVWNLRIPGNASGASVWFQCAQYNQVSNVVATQVE